MQIKRRFLGDDEFLLGVLAALVGLATGLGSVGLTWLIGYITAVSFGVGEQRLGLLAIVLIPAVGGLITGPIIYKYAREAKGHGVPEVMLAVSLLGGRIRGAVAVVKTIASVICIGTGGSAGREGPIVQIGATLGSVLGQKLNLTPERVKTLVACGAAGGISATFNAPLAGIFFAMEVILGEYGLRLLTAVVISSVSASVVARRFLGSQHEFVVPPYTLQHPWEILSYAALGVVCAVAAIGFIKALYASEDFFDALPFSDALKPALGGLLLGVLGYLTLQPGQKIPACFGSGYAFIDASLAGHLTLWAALGMAVARLLATCFTLGSGNSGGVFAPTLYMGAMLGLAWGEALRMLFPDHAPPSGGYALIGMAAMFAGAAQAPLSAIIIIFELSGDYQIILLVMTSVVISTGLVNAWFGESIYTLKLVRRGIDIHRMRGVDPLSSTRVVQAAVPDDCAMTASTTVSEALAAAAPHRHTLFVWEGGAAIGVVRRSAMLTADPDAPLRSLLEPPSIRLPADASLYDTLELLTSLDVDSALVYDHDRPVGIVTGRSMVNYLGTLKKDRGPVSPIE